MKQNRWFIVPTLILISVLGLGACSSPPSLSQPQPSQNPTQQTPEPKKNKTVSAPKNEQNPVSTAPSSPEANADVQFVEAVYNGDTWTFSVTVSHPDTGWDDYADGWDVVTPDGTVIKNDPTDPFTRVLLHPHENEQPFTRGQSGLVIPEGVDQVLVRAHDLVDGFGGQQVTVDLNQTAGDGFRVNRSQD